MVGGDRFAWITAACGLSTSQDEILRNASEAEMGNEEKGVLVSPVNSSGEWSDDDVDEEEEKEVFRTPPERHSHSLTSSNEAMMGVRVAVVVDAVDCGGQENGHKTVDLSRDSEMDVAEFIVNRSGIAVDGLLETDKECVPIRAAGVVDRMKVDDCIDNGADTLNISTKLSSVEKEVQECSEAVMMDENVMMDGVAVFSSGCVEVTRVAEESYERAVDGEIIRICHDADIGVSKCSGDVGSGKVDEFWCRDNIVVERVERVGSSATNMSVSHNVNSNKRMLPSSFTTGSNKVGGEQIGQKVGRVRSGVEVHGSRVETHKRTSGEGADKGPDEAGAVERGVAGKKGFEPSNKVLADNILKVLDYLVMKQEENSVYEEKPDIIGSAIKAGVKFPRPSWKPEDGDDDSVDTSA